VLAMDVWLLLDTTLSLIPRKEEFATGLWLFTLMISSKYFELCHSVLVVLSVQCAQELPVEFLYNSINLTRHTVKGS
jgi:hypothetical protein